MLNKLYFGIFLIGLTSFFTRLVAQDNFVDYNPQYQTWSSDYQIDKIEFTANYSIIHFRFAKENSSYDNPIFHRSGEEFAWVLEDEQGNVYPQKKLTNICRNGILQIEELQQKEQSITAWVKGNKTKTIFSCQIYFSRLPKNINYISLVEGAGYASKRNHLNCLNINLKNENRQEASNEKERIKQFEQQLFKPKSKTPTNQTLKKQKVVIHSSPSHSNQTIIPEIEYITDDFDQKETISTASNTIWVDSFEDYTNPIVIDKPTYRLWDKDYVLEKVVYTKTEIIFSVVVKFSRATDVTFYPVYGKHPWFLKDSKSGKKYPLKKVSNIRKNGELQLEKLTDFPLKLKTIAGEQATFSCRVHFDRLPASIDKVHLIEGKNKANDKNHFNFFDIKLVHPNL